MILSYPSGPSQITGVLSWLCLERERDERTGKRSKRCEAAGLEEGGKGHTPGNGRDSHLLGKGKAAHTPRVSRATRPWVLTCRAAR